VLASALCMDKVLFKELMAPAGVPQVDYRAVQARSWLADPAGVTRDLAPLGVPVFVKPSRMGSSVGIVKVTTADALSPALEQAFVHDPLVIVERMALGMEVECSVLGDADPEASQPGEIVLHGEWYDYSAKYSPGGMDLVVPARISAGARERVRALAVEAFVRAGCSGLARVDFFIEEGDRVLLNELNTMPGFTPTSVYAKLWTASGIEYPELVDRLCRIALDRHAAQQAYRF
jgi:D-alanine-D-alanine ligase